MSGRRFSVIRKGLLLLLFSSYFHGSAQTTNNPTYAAIDAEIRTFSADSLYNADSLLKFVNSRFTDDAAKVRAFYTWIALNIRYDKSLLDQYKLTSALQLHNFAPGGYSQAVDTVLARGRAVCEGFCNLMNYFCARSGIRSSLVPGITRVPDGEVLEDILHTWTVVKIDSGWKLLDIAWAGGYVDGRNQYVHDFSGKYFFTSPDLFVKTHWPLDMMWQLLEFPVTKQEFYQDTPPSAMPYFNFRDSISAYLLIPEKEREYTDLLHYQRYDTANRLYKEGADRYIYNKAASLFNKAALYLDDYAEYAAGLKGREIGSKEINKCLRLLQEPKHYLEEGLKFSASRKFYTAEVKNNFEQMVQASSKKLIVTNHYIETYRQMLASLR